MALSIEADVTDGGTLSYQWYSSDEESGIKGKAIEEAEQAEYTPSTAVVGTVWYYCIVTNERDGKSAEIMSGKAKITVTESDTSNIVLQPAKPKILQQPKGAAYIKGKPAVPLKVTASVTDKGTLSYQWYSSVSYSVKNGRKIIGANKTAYTPSTAVAGTLYYYCIVMNTKSGKQASVTTALAKIEVKPAPVPPVQLQNGNPIEYQGLKFIVTNAGKGEVAFAGSADKNAVTISVPETIEKDKKTYTVTEIKQKAFKGLRKLKKVTIGANIKKIGKQAFYNCKNLKTIIIKGTKIKTIQVKAFKGVSKNVKVKMPKKLNKKNKKQLQKKLIRAGISKKAKFK